jgi:hypothetical protein
MLLVLEPACYYAIGRIDWGNNEEECVKKE